jgi:hypothetical protein
MFGGAMIAGLAYVQYQAAREDIFCLNPYGIDGRLLSGWNLNRGWKFRNGHLRPGW